MYGAIIGAAVAVGGSIYNSIKQSKLAQKEKERLNVERDEYINWRNREYGSSSLESANRAFTKQRENIQALVDRAKGSAAIAGGSDYAGLKAGLNKSIGDTMSTVATLDEARRDKAEAQYQANMKDLNKRMSAVNASQQANTAAATGQAISAGGSMIASSLDNNKNAKSAVASPTVPDGKVKSSVVQSTQPTSLGGKSTAWFNPQTGRMEYGSYDPYSSIYNRDKFSIK